MNIDDIFSQIVAFNKTKLFRKEKLQTYKNINVVLVSYINLAIPSSIHLALAHFFKTLEYAVFFLNKQNFDQNFH